MSRTKKKHRTTLLLSPDPTNVREPPGHRGLSGAKHFCRHYWEASTVFPLGLAFIDEGVQAFLGITRH